MQDLHQKYQREYNFKTIRIKKKKEKTYTT